MVQGKRKAYAKAQRLTAPGEFQELHGGPGVRTQGGAGREGALARLARQAGAEHHADTGRPRARLSPICPVCKKGGTLPPACRVSGRTTRDRGKYPGG